MDATLGLYEQLRSQLVDLVEYDALVASSSSREPAWSAYAAAVDIRMGDTVRAMEASSEAWFAEQRKFCELSVFVRVLGRQLSARKADSPTSRKT